MIASSYTNTGNGQRTSVIGLTPKTLEYRDVRLTRWVKEPYKSRPILRRTAAGAAVLRIVQRCMTEGGTVSLSTRYDKHNCEFMDATLVWDGDQP